MEQRYVAINYRYFIKLEQDLLFQMGTYFSAEYFRQLRLRLELEFNPQRFHFSRYLQGLVAFRQKKYEQASSLFAHVSLSEIPNESQYFLQIYQTITDFLVQKNDIHQTLQLLRQKLPAEYYGYLLVKLMISLQSDSTQHSRNFYLRLQLSMLLPKLQASIITAQLYFELGHFYLEELPNALLAVSCFEKAQALLTKLPNATLATLTLRGLALASSQTNNDKRTSLLYEQLISAPLWNQQIDSFYYFMSIIEAITFFQKSFQSEKANQLYPLLKEVETLKKSEQKAILQFAIECLQIDTNLANLKGGSSQLALTVKTVETLLISLKHHERVSQFQITWFRLRGKIALRSYQFISAKNYFLDALRLNQKTQHLHLQSALHYELSQTFAALEQFEHAIKHFEYFDALRHELVTNQKNHALVTQRSRYHDQTIANLLVKANTTYQQIYTQATTDSLTQLGNRQALTNLEYHFQEILPIACAMIDLDFFKKYNDFYGHLAGDKLLKQFAVLLKKCFPNYHLIRYGGEEFLVIAINSSAACFEEQLYQLQLELSQANIPHHGIAEDATVTMSIGYSSSLATQNLSTLISEADIALYEAKRLGKNQIIASTTKTTRLHENNRLYT